MVQAKSALSSFSVTAYSEAGIKGKGKRKKIPKSPANTALETKTTMLTTMGQFDSPTGCLGPCRLSDGDVRTQIVLPNGSMSLSVKIWITSWLPKEWGRTDSQNNLTRRPVLGQPSDFLRDHWERLRNTSKHLANNIQHQKTTRADSGTNFSPPPDMVLVRLFVPCTQRTYLKGSVAKYTPKHKTQ